MNPSASWREFFDAHAERYEENVFTQNTRFEVEFLADLLDLPQGATLLDVGCGTGRHAIGFAKRGVRVTGIDLSGGMLEVASRNAAAAGVEVEWVQADATEWTADRLYDAAICLCEGGIGLADLDEDPLVHDASILRNVAASLKPGAPFVLTALNGYATIRQMTDEHVRDGVFDPATMLSMYIDEMDLPEGKVQRAIRERLLIPPEMASLLRYAGFDVLHIWGGTAGEWGRRPLKLDEIEAMYVARRRA